jgi:hypothetical protein
VRGFEELAGGERIKENLAIAVKGGVACLTAFAMVFTSVMVASGPSQAATKNVKVTINVVWQIDLVDSNNEADFYWYITLGGLRVKSAEPYTVNDDKIEPAAPTTFSNLPSGGGQTYTFTIELWDDDGSSDDQCDISRVAGGTGSGGICTMVYYIDTNTWTGDDGYAGDPQVGYTNGEDSPDGSTTIDQNDCALWFSVSWV